MSCPRYRTPGEAAYVMQDGPIGDPVRAFVVNCDGCGVELLRLGALTRLLTPEFQLVERVEKLLREHVEDDAIDVDYEMVEQPALSAADRTSLVDQAPRASRDRSGTSHFKFVPGRGFMLVCDDCGDAIGNSSGAVVGHRCATKEDG